MPLPWKKKDREDGKKLTPEQKAKKKKISSALEKDSKFKKKYGKRADEVRSRIANKMAQKNESYNPYKKILYSLLEANNESEFVEDVIRAVQKHHENPGKIISSERGDDFDILDHAREAAKNIEYHMRNKETLHPSEHHKHERRVNWLRTVLPEEIVSGLISKHFR